MGGLTPDVVKMVVVLHLITMHSFGVELAHQASKIGLVHHCVLGPPKQMAHEGQFSQMVYLVDRRGLTPVSQ